MLSLFLHFKEFQPIYAYKGYAYCIKKCIFSILNQIDSHKIKQFREDKSRCRTHF